MSDFPSLGVAALATVHGGRTPRAARRSGMRLINKFRVEAMHHSLHHCKVELGRMHCDVE